MMAQVSSDPSLFDCRSPSGWCCSTAVGLALALPLPRAGALLRDKCQAVSTALPRGLLAPPSDLGPDTARWVILCRV